jgi:hypothetical protein
MESHMVENKGLNPEESIDLVEKYFEGNFNEYILLKKTNYTGYWWVEYPRWRGYISTYDSADLQTQLCEV